MACPYLTLDEIQDRCESAKSWKTRTSYKYDHSIHVSWSCPSDHNKQCGMMRFQDLQIKGWWMECLWMVHAALFGDRSTGPHGCHPSLLFHRNVSQQMCCFSNEILLIPLHWWRQIPSCLPPHECFYSFPYASSLPIVQQGYMVHLVLLNISFSLTRPRM